jgi:hypothetical protein
LTQTAYHSRNCNNKYYCLTQEDAPWNPSSFSDQVADKFYQQVINTENYNSSSTNLSDTRTVELNRNNSRYSYYDPSYLLANNLQPKPAHLVLTQIQFNMPISIVQHTVPTNTDPHYSKALRSKIDDEKFSPYFVFIPYEVI